MKTYTVADIRALDPCYDPTRYVAEDWTGTVLDLLRLSEVPPQDRLWVANHWLSERTLRLFAVWCARQTLALIDEPDPRSVAACDVAERHAHGEASQNELAAAEDAAGDARAAAGDAWDARDAWAAAGDARAAAGAAAGDAWDAARDAAGDAQIEHLIRLVEAHELEPA